MLSASSISRRGRGIAAVVAVVLLEVMTGVAAFADNRPVITVSRGRLSPQRIEVHVGELVRWRTDARGRLRLEMDPHRGAHEVVERSSDIRALFRRPGEHRYTALISGNGRSPLQGVVVVREPRGEASFPPVCGPGSSDRICFEP